MSDQQHPSLETIAAAIDRSLPQAEHDAAMQHIAACDDCYELLAGSLDAAKVTTERAASPSNVVPLFRRFVAPLSAAAAVILAVVGILVWHAMQRSAFERVIAAAGDRYPVEARLSHGFEPSTGGIVRGSQEDGNPDLIEEAARLEKRRDVRSRHAFAIAQLLRGHRDEAISLLESLSTGSNDTDLWSDLAAAYLSRGRDGDGDRALAAADKALAVAPHSREALFNRALALDYLRRDADAARAWNAFLAEDPESEWSQVAKRKLKRRLAAPGSAA